MKLIYTRPAIRILLIYLTVGFLYIFFSDSLLLRISDSPQTISFFQTIKGFLFIILSGLLIAFLVNREIVSRRSETTRRLKEHALFQKLLSNIPGIDAYIIDADLRCLVAQGTEMQKFGLKSENMIGKRPDELEGIPDESKEWLMAKYISIFSGHNITEDFSFGDNWYQFRGLPYLEENGTISAAIAVVVNINHLQNKIIEVTGQRDEYEMLNIELNRVNQELVVAREKAIESDKLKTAFLNNISHEIRTPLNGILGFSDLLTADDLSADKKIQYAGVIKSSSQQLLTIINDILDISKIETRQLKIVPQTFHVNTELQILLSMLQNLVRQHGKSIEVRLEPGLPDGMDSLVMDKIRLVQVLTNLVSNAVKYTHKGTIKLGYTIDDQIAEFYVSDTGIGIPEGCHKAIFERFRQVDNATTRQYGGSGLGLAISKGIVELMGGTINVESQPGEGSRFSVRLPYIPAVGSRSIVTSLMHDIQLNPSTILVAEDDESSFELLKEMLDGSPVTFLHALDGKSAVNIFRAQPTISLVLMDIQMPVMDGMAAAKVILEINPKIPIIAQTAYALPEDRERCLKAGFVDYIVKPVERKLLISLLRKYL